MKAIRLDRKDPVFTLITAMKRILDTDAARSPVFTQKIWYTASQSRVFASDKAGLIVSDHERWNEWFGDSDGCLYISGSYLIFEERPVSDPGIGDVLDRFRGNMKLSLPFGKKKVCDADHEACRILASRNIAIRSKYLCIVGKMDELLEEVVIQDYTGKPVMFRGDDGEGQTRFIIQPLMLTNPDKWEKCV